MIVERIMEEEEITSILKLEDPRLEKQVLSRLQCTQAEWVQWIVMYTRQPDFMGLWAVKEGKDIKAYMIAVNAVAPPISRSVSIVYQSFFGMKDADGDLVALQAVEQIKEWAKEKGALNISIFTDKPRINALYGFEAEKGVSMVMKL